MAYPVPDSYSGASGGVIAGGRYHFPLNARIAIWGQSNAVGRADVADISTSPLSSDPGLAAFIAGAFSRVFIWTGSAYQQLTAANSGCNAGQFGPEFGLAVRWMRETQSGNLYLHKEASSGVSITQFTPYLWPATDFVNRHNAGTAWLSENEISGVVDAGWVWIQGESDQGQTQGWYQTRLTEIIVARLAQGLSTTGTKSLLMQMAVGSAQYDANIAAAKDAIAAASPSNTFAPSMPLYMKTDNLHQNGRGQVQAGYDAFELIFSVSHIDT